MPPASIIILSVSTRHRVLFYPLFVRQLLRTSTMDTVSNSSNRALVVHRDESDVARNESAAAHPANEIVLDAL
eukprot:scaffold29430_cov67-Skeletonema_dohrnii-CCMP3373.AAC.1